MSIITNQGTSVNATPVQVKYNGKTFNAIALGYASGPFYMEKIILLDDKTFEYEDFDEVNRNIEFETFLK